MPHAVCVMAAINTPVRMSEPFKHTACILIQKYSVAIESTHLHKGFACGLGLWNFGLKPISMERRSIRKVFQP